MRSCGRFTVETGTEHGVEHQVEFERFIPVPCPNDTARLLPALSCRQRVTRELPRVFQSENRHLQPSFQGQPGDDVTVTTVIASPA